MENTLKEYAEGASERPFGSSYEEVITRTKFNVQSITEYGNGGGRKITMAPVVSGSEENKSFWDYTPSGVIELQITNPEAKFELGEYYVDFTKAD